MNERDAKLFAFYSRIEVENAVEDIDQFSGQFDTGKSSADNNKVTKASTKLAVLFEFDPSQPSKNHVSDFHRVSDGFERQRVFGHARNEIQSCATTERQD